MQPADRNGQHETPTPQDVSVVVAANALDRWGHLRKTRAVLGQREPVGEIVLVVDFNDHLLSAARAVFPEIAVIPSSVNAGLAGARETGAAHSSGQVVAFLDDGSVVTPEWSRWIAEGYDGPDTIAVGGRFGRQRPRPASSWWPPVVEGVGACTHRGLALGGELVRAMIGANLSVRADVLDALGPAAAPDEPGDADPSRCVRAHRRPSITPGASTWQYVAHECQSVLAVRALAQPATC